MYKPQPWLSQPFWGWRHLSPPPSHNRVLPGDQLWPQNEPFTYCTPQPGNAQEQRVRGRSFCHTLQSAPRIVMWHIGISFSVERAEISCFLTQSGDRRKSHSLCCLHCWVSTNTEGPLPLAPIHIILRKRNLSWEQYMFYSWTHRVQGISIS